MVLSIGTWFALDQGEFYGVILSEAIVNMRHIKLALLAAAGLAASAFGQAQAGPIGAGFTYIQSLPKAGIVSGSNWGTFSLAKGGSATGLLVDDKVFYGFTLSATNTHTGNPVAMPRGWYTEIDWEPASLGSPETYSVTLGIAGVSMENVFTNGDTYKLSYDVGVEAGSQRLINLVAQSIDDPLGRSTLTTMYNAATLTAINTPVPITPVDFEAVTSTLVTKDNDSKYFTFSFTQTTIPEPWTLALLGTGLAGLGLIRRRK